MVPVAGLEPARYCYQWILSPPRLPIPTHRRNIYYTPYFMKKQAFFIIFLFCKPFYYCKRDRTGQRAHKNAGNSENAHIINNRKTARENVKCRKLPEIVKDRAGGTHPDG